jgi:Transposase
MIIVGLDVCKSSVVACALSVRPNNPRQVYYSQRFYTFEASQIGVRSLLELNADIAVLEPTGVNYSKLWVQHLIRAGIKVCLVGHTQLRYYRANHLELPDKDDQADALALACYGFDYLDAPHRFVNIRDNQSASIREIVLRLAHLNRLQSPIINRLRQDLAWQFPEVANMGFVLANGKTPVVVEWLAQNRESAKYDNLYNSSVGLGLTDTVRLHALRLCDIHAEEIALLARLKLMATSSEFEPYQKVFRRFGFGARVSSIILSQIYPFENFLIDGVPEVKVRKGRKSGKPTKRYLSRRRFEKALGAAPTEESSGLKNSSRIVGGSDLCRKALWQWVFSRIEPHKTRLNNEIGRVLGVYLDEAKAKGQPIKLARMKCTNKAVRMLFDELVKELV